MAGERPPLNPSNVAELPNYIRNSVSSLLAETFADCKKKHSIAFSLPKDSHVLPLFGNEMFSQLVKYHNEHPVPNLFVEPFVLMSFDSDINSYKKRIKNGIEIQGEDIVTHELRHYFEYQSLLKDPHKPIQLSFTFSWDVWGEDYKLVCDAALKRSDSLTEDKMRQVYVAPHNPSRSDMRKFHRSFFSLNPLRWIPHLQMVEQATRSIYACDDIDPEFLDTWLYRNRNRVDSKQFHWNARPATY